MKDTIGIMDVFGGINNDTFGKLPAVFYHILCSYCSPFQSNTVIGQMYNSERSVEYGVATDDPIDLTVTTKGFLSDGNSHPVTINGGYGDDTVSFLTPVTSRKHGQ